MIELLKRHRVLQALLGGTAAVGAGAAAGEAAIILSMPAAATRSPAPRAL